MPIEITKHSEVLSAIGRIKAISELMARDGEQFKHELDIEVMVYGRNYNGKLVGPYVKLLTYEPGEVIIKEGDWGGNSFYIIVAGSVEVFINDQGKDIKVSDIPEGVQFGEMSVLAGIPRTATIKAPPNRAIKVLELQRPALRLLRKFPVFGESLDTSYRVHGLALTLQDLRKTAKLSDEQINQLRDISQYKIYSKNHVLFRAGEPIRKLYLLKSGWARVTKRENATRIILPDAEARNWKLKSPDSFVGPSHIFGIEAVTKDSSWNSTCLLPARTEVFEVSINRLRMFPDIREKLMGAFADSSGLAKKPTAMPIAKSQEELIDTGLIDATNLLVMDMSLCVRCGNCSTACHEIHGKSRLVRRGIHISRPVALNKKANFQSLLAPAVCLHCKDPECLTGCPTGAIARFSDGQVDINTNTCIGCSDCAIQCPYNAISMVPLSELVNGSNGNAKPANKKSDDLVAVKCNLCVGTSLNPPGKKVKKQAYSCEENCPTGSLLRVDPKVYFSEVKNIEGVMFKNGHKVILRHSSHIDWGKRALHIAGLLLTIGFTVLTIIGLMRYGYETPLAGVWLDMRWVTGLVGLAGTVIVMIYPIRKSNYTKRAGPLRYWLLSHTYIGVIAGILILLHSGKSSGGALTTALSISFDLVILTGLVGIIAYYFVPRLLIKIEGEPLLIDDLLMRREELSTEVSTIMSAASPDVVRFVKKCIFPKVFSLSFLLRQYFICEPLDTIIERTKQQLRKIAVGFSQNESGEILSLIEKAVTMRRADALIYLHKSLKIWLPPHVIFTSLMLALMVIHIIQVIYLSAK